LKGTAPYDSPLEPLPIFAPPDFIFYFPCIPAFSENFPLDYFFAGSSPIAP